MSLRCDQYSLRQILLDLQKEFSGVQEAYIFGSRRHRTRSTRSDLDILLVAEVGTVSEDLRDFALRVCPALDFFLLDGAVAISCSNGSKVRGTSKKNLIERLDGLPLWSSSKGFFESDVDWDFEVIRGMNYMMTTMISSVPFPSKADAVSSVQGLNESIPGMNGWSTVKDHPLWVLAITVVTTAGLTFAAVNSLRIIPLQDRIHILQKDLEKSAAQVKDQKTNKAIKPAP